MRLGYILLAVPVTSSALALGFWLVLEWGSFALLPCPGHIACVGAPPLLSWAFLLVLALGVVLFRKGIGPAPGRLVPRATTLRNDL